MEILMKVMANAEIERRLRRDDLWFLATLVAMVILMTSPLWAVDPTPDCHTDTECEAD